MVTERTRIDFSGYKISTVLRRLQRRFAAPTDCFNPPEYVSYCERHPEELDALARETLISVTEFFRDREAFHALATRINDLVAKNRRAKNAASGWWVALPARRFTRLPSSSPKPWGHACPNGCCRFLRRTSTKLRSPLPVAAYPLAALAEMQPELASRYFTPVDGGMQVARSLRECITFARQNLVADPPFLRLDIVTCRNVLIYFNTELQARALATLHFGLREDGMLFLGRSENANHHDELFSPLDRRNRLFKRRETPSAGLILHRSSAAPWPRAAPAGPHKAAPPMERQFLEAVGDANQKPDGADRSRFQHSLFPWRDHAVHRSAPGQPADESGPDHHPGVSR